MINFILGLFKKKKEVLEIPPPPIYRGEIFRINLKMYPNYIQFIAMCPSTQLFNQDSFDYKVQKVGSVYEITSDYNNGCVIIREGSELFNWLESQN